MIETFNSTVTSSRVKLLKVFEQWENWRFRWELVLNFLSNLFIWFLCVWILCNSSDKEAFHIHKWQSQTTIFEMFWIISYVQSSLRNLIWILKNILTQISVRTFEIVLNKIIQKIFRQVVTNDASLAEKLEINCQSIGKFFVKSISSETIL